MQKLRNLLSNSWPLKGEGEKQLTKDGVALFWTHLKDLCHEDASNAIKECPHLTKEAVFDLMRLKMAAQSGPQ